MKRPLKGTQLCLKGVRVIVSEKQSVEQSHIGEQDLCHAGFLSYLCWGDLSLFTHSLSPAFPLSQRVHTP